MPLEKESIRAAASELNKNGVNELTQYHNEKAFSLIQQAAQLLAPIAENFDDWRNLSAYQMNAGVAATASEQKMLWFERAIFSLNLIPQKDFTCDDWRNLAKIQNKIGINKPETQATLQYYESAIQSLEHIPKHGFKHEDWAHLALYQNNVGTHQKEPEQKLSWYEKALSNMEHVPLDEELLKGAWRLHAKFQFNMACVKTLPPEQKRIWLQKAIATFHSVPEHMYDHNDWRELAVMQSWCGHFDEDRQQKLQNYKKAIGSLGHIPEQNFTNEDWSDLESFRRTIAIICNKNKDWKQAQEYYHLALDACIKTKVGSTKLANTYRTLSTFVIKNSLTYELYHFAEQVFAGVHIPDTELQLFRIHEAIVDNHSPSKGLQRKFAQFLRLLETMTTRSDFPSPEIKRWLTESRQQITDMLQTVEQAVQPLSLLNMADQAPTLNVAIAHKLSILETMINDLKKENQNLKQENEALRNAQSAYQNQLTLFEKDLNVIPSAKHEGSPSIAGDHHDRAWILRLRVG